MRGVFLDEVVAGDGDLGLVGPGAAEFELRAVEDRAGLGLDQQFGDVALAEEVGVGLDDFDDIGGLAGDGDFARPGEGGAAAFAGLAVGQAVDLHLIIGQPAQDAAGQHTLDEDVLFQHHLFASLGAEALEDAGGGFGPFVPGDGADDGLHVDEAFDALGVAAGPVEAERGAPVVDHEGEVVAEVHAVEPGVEPLGVVDEAVGAGGRGAGLPHADQVGREAARDVGAVGHDVAPEVGGGGVAVEEDDWVARALVDVGHRGFADGQALAGEVVLGGDVGGHGCVFRSVGAVEMVRAGRGYSGAASIVATGPRQAHERTMRGDERGRACRWQGLTMRRFRPGMRRR